MPAACGQSDPDAIRSPERSHSCKCHSSIDHFGRLNASTMRASRPKIGARPNEEMQMGPFPHDAPPPRISKKNPAGTDGFEFVEFAHPEPEKLGKLFSMMGYV